MKIIFSKHITARELWKIPNAHDMEVIMRSCEKEIFVPLGGATIPPHTSLIKVYATSKAGARRIVFLLQNTSGDRFFLFYRDKNDSIGENITIKNKHFRETLSKYLTMLKEDIKNDEYEEVEL